MLGLEPGSEAAPHFPDGIERIELSGGSDTRQKAEPRHGFASADPAIESSNGTKLGLRAADIFANLEHLLDPEKTGGDRASYRFEIVGAGTWAFAVDDGKIVRRSPEDPADCVIRMNEQTFMDINVGQGNPMTAFLRGAMGFEGDLLLVSKLDSYTR
jgi:hypothetical protein